MGDGIFQNGQLAQWPYPIRYGEVTQIDVDVLVVGGGLSGGCAGIFAARSGVKVAVVDKAPIKRSGCGGAGMDHWNNFSSNPKSPVTPETLAEQMSGNGGLTHQEYIAMKGTYEVLMELEKMGLDIRDRNDDFAGTPTRDEDTKLLKAYDYQDMVAIKLRGGHYIKPVIHNALKAENVSLYERVMVTSLLTESGKQGTRVVGATGFSMETGEFFVFSAKSVIISTGYVCSIWTFSTEITGGSYRWDPNEIGEGLAMAWNAGAEIYGFSNAGSTHGSHPFAWPRFGIGNPSNTWFPCSIIDDNGKHVPWEDYKGRTVETIEARNLPADGQPYIASGHDGGGHTTKTPYLTKDLPRMIENQALQLPLWADLEGMPEPERRSIWGVMVGNEGKSRYTLYDYYTREGFNPDTDMLWCPIMAPDGYKSRGWFHGEPNIVKPWRTEAFGGQGEIATDWNGMSTLNGLFCAGAASGLEGCSYACSSGMYTGRRAAEYAKNAATPEIDPSQLQKEFDRVYAPIRRNGNPNAYISWKELWAGSARVMQQCCGEFRTMEVLDFGMNWLHSIKKTEMQQTFARTPHELARVLECETRITVSEIYLISCMAKVKENGGIPVSTEESFGAKKKKEKAKSLLFQRLENGKPITYHKENEYWLKGENAPTYLENYQRHNRRDIDDRE